MAPTGVSTSVYAQPKLRKETHFEVAWAGSFRRSYMLILRLRPTLPTVSLVGNSVHPIEERL
jgi:hypothetical protein